MSNNKRLLFLMLFLSLFPVHGAWSIEYNIDNYKAKWSDRRASSVGDIVTILIKEKARASSSAGLDADNSHTIGITNDIKGRPFNFDAGINSEMNGDSSTSRNGSISAMITARVVDIDHYGILKVEGSQFVTVNGEEQKITISGFVRQNDLSSQNAIISSRIESARIELSGIGEVNNNRNPSIFRSLFRWLGF